MAKHKTFFGKIFGWIGDIFQKANKAFLQAAVEVTSKIKDALNLGVVDLITSVIPGTLDDKVVAFLRQKLPVLLAKELLLQNVGTPATEEEAQALAKNLIEGFGVLTDEDKEQFYTTIAAKIYIFLKAHEKGEKVTFGEAAALVESAYKSWLQLKENDDEND